MENRAINVLDYIYLLVRRWKLIVGNFVAICVIAAIVSLLLPKWYTATSTILPPEEKKEQFGLGALLSQVSIPRLKLGEKGTPADIFLGILKSRRMADMLIGEFDLRSIYKVKTQDEAVRKLAANTTVERTDDGLISVTVLDRDPERCAKIATTYMAFLDTINLEMYRNAQIKIKSFVEQQYQQTLVALEAAQDSLGAFQKRHGVISVKEQAVVAIKAAADLQTEIMALDLQLEALKAASLSEDHPEIQLAEKRIEIRKGQLEELRTGRTANPGEETSLLFLPLEKIPDLQVEYLRREMEIEVQKALAQFLRQNLEEKKIEANRKLPTVAIVDEGMVPERRTKPKRRVIVMAAGAFSLFFSLLSLLAMEYIHAIEEAGGPNAEKLAKVQRELPWRRSRGQ